MPSETHKPTENPDAEIATRHEEAAPGAASGGTRVSESPGVSSPHRTRFKVAYNPGVGGRELPKAEVIAKVRDHLAEMDEIEDDEVEVIVSRNVPADDQFYVFNVELITELA